LYSLIIGLRVILFNFLAPGRTGFFITRFGIAPRFFTTRFTLALAPIDFLGALLFCFLASAIIIDLTRASFFFVEKPLIFNRFAWAFN